MTPEARRLSSTSGHTRWWYSRYVATTESSFKSMARTWRVIDRCALSREGLHGLPLPPETVDGELDDVARFQIERLGFVAQADTGRRTRADDVTRKERHELADVAHERRGAEHHVG